MRVYGLNEKLFACVSDNVQLIKHRTKRSCHVYIVLHYYFVKNIIALWTIYSLSEIFEKRTFYNVDPLFTIFNQNNLSKLCIFRQDVLLGETKLMKIYFAVINRIVYTSARFNYYNILRLLTGVGVNKFKINFDDHEPIYPIVNLLLCAQLRNITNKFGILTYCNHISKRR